MASILALEKQISILLEQKKLSTGDQTTAINQQLATLRIQMEASNPIQKTAAAESADCELDSLLTNFSKLRVTAKSHRLRGSNATEDEKKRVEEELNWPHYLRSENRDSWLTEKNPLWFTIVPRVFDVSQKKPIWWDEYHGHAKNTENKSKMQ